MNLVYLIRRKSDGQFYRKGKVRYGLVQRTKWTPDPAKAWATHDRKQILTWYLDSNFPKDQQDQAKLEVEIVAFEMTEVPDA